jgi:hypothetical protein
MEAEDTTQPMESRVRGALEVLVSSGSRQAQRFSEELAILKRWYYRSHKAGEIVLANANGDLSIRKVANAMGRVAKGEKPPVATAGSAEP